MIVKKDLRNRFFKKVKENSKPRDKVDDLTVARLWEEYGRKRDNPIVYGLPGTDGPGKSIQVAKENSL